MANRLARENCFGIRWFEKQGNSASELSVSRDLRCGAKLARGSITQSLAILMAIFVLLVVARSARAQEGLIDREYPIKAAYLYNFGKYVEWPPDVVSIQSGGRRDFVIGVVGNNPFGNSLTAIARKKKLKGKAIVIKQIRTTKEYQPCHILFVPARQKPELVSSILKQARGSSVLVVGETKGFSQRGGIVNFYVEQNKVRFEINSDAAESAELKISAKLLRLGRIVRTP